MQNFHSSSKVFFDQVKSRDYKCPCGKSYLSYAALFTHIKQKHQGKAPGKISKPGGYQKRGRPPTKTKNLLTSQKQNMSNDKQQQVQNETKQKQNSKILKKINQDQQRQRIIRQISEIMQEVPQQSGLRSHLNEMQSFTEMLVILKQESNDQNLINNEEKQQNENENEENTDKKLVSCLIEYLSCVSKELVWGKFEQLYVLLVLYLQFIVDEENDRRVIRNGPIDLLCEYINDFIQNHMKAMAEYYELQNLQVMREHTAIEIFNNMFKWMMVKDYSNYVVKANSYVENKLKKFQ